MSKKGLIALVSLALCAASCATSASADRSLSESKSSVSDSFSAYNSSIAEEADPNGFDPNFDYVGTSATDFRVIASRYSANPEFVSEPYSAQDDRYARTLIDFGIIAFSFRGSSVVARHKGGKIIETHRFQSGKMTIGEARTLGFVGEAQAKQSEGFVGYMDAKKPSSTKRYEKRFDQSFGNYNHTDGQGRDIGIDKYIEFFTRYGIPTSMLVYYDGWTEAEDYINKMEGHGYCGLAVDYASAIPVYSDDLAEVVGAMTLGHRGTNLSYAFTYLKEDGFDTVKDAKSMIAQVTANSIEVIQNPRFYVEDTSILPKGDWRIILGDGKDWR
jgi:hypothetical protein